MWARLLLVVSSFAESREMVEEGQIDKPCSVGPWALVGRALMGPALMGQALMGQALKGQALMGRALMGRALNGPGPHGPPLGPTA